MLLHFEIPEYDVLHPSHFLLDDVILNFLHLSLLAVLVSSPFLLFVLLGFEFVVWRGLSAEFCFGLLVFTLFKLVIIVLKLLSFQDFANSGRTYVVSGQDLGLFFLLCILPLWSFISIRMVPVC